MSESTKSHRCAGPCCDGWRNIIDEKNQEIEALAESIHEIQEDRNFTSDWYKERFERMDHWMRNRAPSEIRDEYFSIQANASPTPWEKPRYVETVHALKLRAESAEKSLREAVEESKTIKAWAQAQHDADGEALREAQERIKAYEQGGVKTPDDWPECKHGVKLPPGYMSQAGCYNCLIERAETAEVRVTELNDLISNFKKHDCFSGETFESMVKKISGLEKDIESGFMAGAYARLKNLQEAESRASVAEARLKELEAKIFDMQANCDGFTKQHYELADRCLASESREQALAAQVHAMREALETVSIAGGPTPIVSLMECPQIAIKALAIPQSVAERRVAAMEWVVEAARGTVREALEFSRQVPGETRARFVPVGLQDALAALGHEGA